MIKRLLILALLAGASTLLGESAVGVPETDRPPSSLEHLTATLLEESGGTGAEPVELEGTLEVLVEDWQDHSRLLHFLASDTGGRYALHFAAEEPRLVTGARVKVKGLRVGGAIAVESGTRDVEQRSDRQAMIDIRAGTFGMQKTAVILVNFRDMPTQTWVTPAQAQNIVFGTGTASSVTNFYYEASYQQAWLEGDVYGIYTIPVNSTTCDYASIAIQGKRAAATQVGSTKMATYRRFVYAFPSNTCGWAGLGTLGGNPSEAWIKGTFKSSVVSHELGHNFGLYHSHALSCGDRTIGVIGTNCGSIEYGDELDVMGSTASPMHFNAVQKELLGWLNHGSSPPITTVQASGVYTLDSYEQAGAQPKALRVKTPSGDSYYIEYRRPLGFDAAISSAYPGVSNGVVLHLWSQQNGNTIYMLLPTPFNWANPSLSVGSTFTDPAAGITIAPVSVNAGTATVRVTFGSAPPPTCTHVSPTVGVTSSATGGVPHGTKVTYTILVTNKDVSPCTASSFNFGASAPPDWSLAWGITSLSIAPGITASTSLQITSPASAASGTYTLNGKATNAGAASATTSFPMSYVVSSSGGGGGATGSFSDDFNRADSTSLGSGWTEVAGDLVIKGNTLKNAPGVASHKAVVSTLSGATQTVSADFMSPNNNQGPVFGLILKYQNPTNYSMAYRQVGGSAVLKISRVVNGTETILAKVSQGNPAVNVPFKLTARVSGAAISLDLNGVNRLNVNDTALPAGKVGVLINSSSTTMQYQADNFTASAQ